jgi:pre-rRNA-processing protein TSR2
LNGDFQHVAVLEQIYQDLKKRPRSDKVAQPPQTDVDDADGDSGDEMEDEGGDGQAMAVDETSREAANAPIVDEDGFQLVQGKGRRRK